MRGGLKLGIGLYVCAAGDVSAGGVKYTVRFERLKLLQCGTVTLLHRDGEGGI